MSSNTAGRTSRDTDSLFPSKVLPGLEQEALAPSIWELSTGARTIPSKILESCCKFPDKMALIYKVGHIFGFIQYKRLLNLVENFTLSLEKLGVNKGDRVMLISENRPEWAISDLSVKSLGATLVPVHKTFKAEQIKEIAVEVKPALFIVSDSSTLQKIKEVRVDISSHAPIVHMDTISVDDSCSGSADNVYDFISALQLMPHDDHSAAYKNKLQSVTPSDIASIIYAPSASGRYLGVTLTHHNIVSNVESTKEAISITDDDRFLSVLPLSHAFEEIAGYYVPLFSGATISFMPDMAAFQKVVKAYKPTVIIGVPRFYEKIYQRITNSISKNKVRNFALELAAITRRIRWFRLTPLHYVLDALVYKKLRQQFGGELRFLFSGGAPLRLDIANFFSSFGLTILEGYGLTEASPVVSVNNIRDNRPGTVGKPLANVSVVIADDGEILVKGPNVMPGYFNNEKESERAFVNGWLRTGDLGELDKDGFLKITGKKKDIIILSTGKNVSPKKIESQVEKSDFITQACVIGDGKKSIAALLVPNMEELMKQFPDKGRKMLLNDKEAKAFIQKELDRLLEGFAHYEQVKRFTLIEDGFSAKDGTLTATGSLNRTTVLSKYKELIEGLY